MLLLSSVIEIEIFICDKLKTQVKSSTRKKSHKVSEQFANISHH